MAKHALLSPSGADKWVACAAAPAAEAKEGRDDLNIYAAEGTAAHFLASECLDQGGFKLGDCTGLFIYITDAGEAVWDEPEGSYSFKFPVDSSMVANVNKYLASIQEFKGEDGILLVEQRMNIEPITGEEDAAGTSDAVIIRGTEIQIHDLKYGMRGVDAFENRQLLIYAAAAVLEYAYFAEFEQVTLVIHQPRVYDDPSTFTVSRDEFETLLLQIKTAAYFALKVCTSGDDPYIYATPGDHCSDKYCKVRATCPALAEAVLGVVAGGETYFNKVNEAEAMGSEDEDGRLALLGEVASKVPMIEGWCKAITDRVRTEILDNGNKVPGFKAVMGRKGNRSWESPEALAEVVKGMRVKRETIYKEVPVSPSALDELKKEGLLSVGHWKRLQEIVTWTEAKPTVAPASDKRAEIEVTKEDLTSGFEE